MKKILPIFLISTLFLTLTSCINSPHSSNEMSSSDFTEKEETYSVPEYQGMTIHKTQESATNSILNSEAKKDKSTNSTDLSEMVDYPVEKDDEVKYYVEPNEWFYLNIYLSNPDSYEIQSFTLNGQKYANYMFEEGSTLEKIILHLQAPSKSGYFTFHIEAMKYLDNNEIRDVTMNNNTTIQVGIPYEEIPSCLVKSSIYIDGAQFELEIKDDNELIKDNPIYFYLSDGEKIIKSKKLQIGTNKVDIPDLQIQKAYQYGVITAYDSADGQETHAEWLVKETFQTKTPIAFSYIDPSMNSVEFGLYSEVDYETKLNKISLFDGLKEIKTINPSIDETTFSINDLLSDHSYTIKVDYQYVIQETNYQDIISINFKTEASLPPQVSFELYNKTQTSLSFKLNVLDISNTFELKEVVLSDETGELSIITETKDIYTFDNLFSNRTYFIKASYYFNLNDGKGRQLGKTESFSATTLSYTAPTIKEEQVILDETGFSVSYSMDLNVEGEIDSLILLKNGIEIEKVDSSYASFSDLKPESEYVVQVLYHYDLKDGNGIYNEVASFTYRTFPETKILRFDVENENAIKIGDTIFFSIYLENKRNLIATKVRVNGIELAVSPLSSTAKLLVQVVNDGSFGTGEINFHLDGIYFKQNDEEVFLRTDLSSELFFINGNMKLLEAAIVDKELNRRIYAYPDEQLFLLLRFDNESDFNLEKINGVSISDLNITALDSSNYLLELDMTPSTTSTFVLEQIQYRNDYSQGEINLSKTLSYVTLADRSVVEINDINDLNDIDDYHYYKLTADIDLSNTKYQGSELKGYFDGNNHSISNMKVITNVDGETKLGLFTSATGAIVSLNIKNFFFNIGLNNSIGENVQVAFLAGEGENLSISNCTVDNKSILSFNNGINKLNNAGGFIGTGYGNIEISNSINAGNISGMVGVGGFIGRMSEKNGVNYLVNLHKLENKGSIYGEKLVGGMIGSADNKGKIVLEDVLNSGKTTITTNNNSSYCGAFVGYSYYGVEVNLAHGINIGNSKYLLGFNDQIVKIDNSLNLLDGSYLSSAHNYSNGQNIIETNNSYALSCPETNYSCDKQQIISKEIFNSLGFDASIWSFILNDDKDDIMISLLFD